MGASSELHIEISAREFALAELLNFINQNKPMNKILFHPSSVGNIMTEPRSKSETLSETCKKHLIDVWVQNEFGRAKEVTSIYMEKGLKVEEEAINTYNNHAGTGYVKNELTFTDDYLVGTPDIIDGDLVIDIKSSFDIYTFHNAKFSDLNKLYFWQLQAYMALTDALHSQLIYVLVNTPASIIIDEERKLAFKMGLIDADTNPLYQEACGRIELMHTYDDIEVGRRIHVIDVPRDEASIERLYKRIEECRIYINDNFK